MNERDPLPMESMAASTVTVPERGEFIHAHGDLVDKVNREMPAEEILYDLAELFKIYGDSTLKQSKLVKYRREGKTVFYSLADGHVRTILGQGMEHVAE